MFCDGAGFWWIFPVIFGGFWLLVVFSGFWRWRWWHHGAYGHPNDAQTVLRERYARGEIDANEYQQRRTTLDGR
jgi:putative membrane protein